MRRYELSGNGERPFVFEGERLSSVCGWQGPPSDPLHEVYFVLHLFRTALDRFVVSREWTPESATTPTRLVIASESVSELLVRVMRENASVFEARPFLGVLDRDLLRLAGYGVPPGELQALWQERAAARERLVDLTRRCRAAGAADVALRLDEQRTALRTRLDDIEIALEELSVQWLERTYLPLRAARRYRSSPDAAA